MEDKRITFRIPEALHAEVTKEAEADVRSLNAELVVLLREALEARRKKRQGE